MIFMLRDVRLSYPKLEEPEYFQGVKQRPDDKRRWSASYHVGPQSAATRLNEKGQVIGKVESAKTAIDAALRELAKTQWTGNNEKGKPKFEAILASILSDPKGCCWLDGVRKDLDDGTWILNSHRGEDKGRPLVMDNDKSPIYKADGTLYEGKAGRVFSGCYVNAQVEFWAQDNKAGKGLRCTLMAIQRLRDGDAFSGGTAPIADAFAEVADGADADDMS
jgi:hypothetical protein